MGKIKDLISPTIKAGFVVAGAALTAYSWVSTFFNLPPIIKDWRWGLGVGLFLFFAGTLWYITDLIRKYVWWAEPKIVFSPKRDNIHKNQKYADSANLIVRNDEKIAITDCFATLVMATNLYGEDMIPMNIVENDRLKWKEEKFTSDDCKITIPPKDERTVIVADNLNGFQFSFCRASVLRQHLMGLYSPIKIRIDGKINDKDIKPQFFVGYLYVNNYLGESGEVTITNTDSDGNVSKTIVPPKPEIYTTMFFEKGDWIKDKRIPRSRNIQDNKDTTAKKRLPRTDYQRGAKKMSRKKSTPQTKITRKNTRH
jgi:hypothetical protein